MTTCVLTDCGEIALTRQTVILSAEHLREVLASYGDQDPRILHLEGISGLLVRIGIGGTFGAVHVTGRAGLKESRFATASMEHTGDQAAFGYLGEAWHVPPRYLLPAAAVMDIVAFIYRTRDLPGWVTWARRGDD